MCIFWIRISELPVCDARDLAVQLKPGIRNHVFMFNSVYVYLNCLCAMPRTWLFN